MIYGNVHNDMIEQQIATLPRVLQSAIRFLKDTDLAAHAPGKFDIELDKIPMILQVLDLSTAQRDPAAGDPPKKYRCSVLSRRRSGTGRILQR